jgi:hypothetical protein
VPERSAVRVSLPTSREWAAEIVARAQSGHLCQVPGVSTRAIIDGNPDYLGWISRETETASEQAHRPVGHLTRVSPTTVRRAVQA